MNRIGVVVAGLVAVLAFPGLAAAKSNPRDTAKAAAEAAVAGFLPSGGQPGVCDVRTQSGFFDKNKSYLASCTSADGSFQFFMIANATKGSVNINSPYLRDQLTALCSAGGSTFSAGVKGRFVAVYLGKGAGVSIARGFRDLLVEQTKNVPGHVSIDPPCH